MEDNIANLASRRSIYYPAAEIYAGSPAGFWEYGEVGERIRRKLLQTWRKQLVEKEEFLEIFGAQILPEKVFKASGHLENFNDPIVQCRKCNALHRADQLISAKTKGIVPESLSVEELTKMIRKHEVECSKCKGKEFNEVKKFNMMMKVEIGATGKQVSYLRPETCQSIFLDFQRIYKQSRKNLPLGIAQQGTSFRNEISPRNSLLRAREFGQMEIEIFFNPKNSKMEKFKEVENYKLNLMLQGKETKEISCKEAVKKKIVSSELVAYYLARAQQFYESIGIPKNKIRLRELDIEEKAFYAKESFDLEVLSNNGWIELMACNNRSDYDLKGHEKESKKDLSVSENGEKIVPHIFELSAGIDRALYVLLDLSFRKEKRGKEERIYLDLKTKLAPYIAGVFPLVNKDSLKEKAEKLSEELSSYGIDTVFDSGGSIGRRYARIDEIGVPYAITLDYDTLKDDTATLRERNSLKQKRVKVSELPEMLWKLELEKTTF